MMKKIGLFILLLTPLAVHAQLTAPTANSDTTTTVLTGKTDKVYIFFDDEPIELHAKHSSESASEVVWMRLNVQDKTLDKLFPAPITIPQAGGSTLNVSNYPQIGEGGYQVFVKRLDNPAAIDTFTTWVFRDTFKITAVTYNDDLTRCNALRLQIQSTPSIYEPYVYYSFPDVQPPLRPLGQNTFQGSAQSITWTTSEDIHKGVDPHPGRNWQTQNRTPVYVDNPPPLYDATYTVKVVDLFGKSSTYSLPIGAIATHAKITAQEWKDNMWQTLSSPETATGEALYRLQFSPEESIKATTIHWKSFVRETAPGGGRQMLWKDSTATRGSTVTPTMRYKGTPMPGYLPGSYTMRLIARNETCADSTDINIDVSPSKFAVEAIPNAFTPNGDGQNDIFKFVKGNEPVSLENIRIYIYSRAGMLVYRYEGRADAWEGWDGRLMGARGQVADGLYYYIFSGEGWDGVQYNSAAYKGALHIFR